MIAVRQVGGGSGWVSALSGCSSRRGQIKLHRGARAGLAVDLDVPARLLDEAVHHGEAQAGTLADLLGGEERLEHAVQHLLAHAAAGVGDRDQHILARISPPPRPAHRPRRGRLLAVSIVSVPTPSIASRAFTARFSRALSSWLSSAETRHSPSASTVSTRMLSPRVRRQQVGHAGDQLVDLDRLRRQRLAAGEGEQPLGQGGGAFRARAAPRRSGGPCRAAPPTRSAQPFEIAQDHLKQIVEVVRHAAGELADRLHLLRLAQRFLSLFALFDLLVQALVGDRQFAARLLPVRGWRGSGCSARCQGRPRPGMPCWQAGQ